MISCSSSDTSNSDYHSIFNCNNIEIQSEDIERILNNYGLEYKVHNINGFRRSFIHKSYTTSSKEKIPTPIGVIPLKKKSNERLEFFGDSILEMSVRYYLFRRFPDYAEGDLTVLKIKLVNNDTIGQFSKIIGLDKWFVISSSAEAKQTRNNLKMLGCLFESFISAIFIDADEQGLNAFKVVDTFIIANLERHIDWIHILQTDNNYKHILQVKIQKEFKTTPEYIRLDNRTIGVFLIIGRINPLPHLALDIVNFNNSFTSIKEYVKENNGVAFIKLGVGIHKIKKNAEQLACKNALDNLIF